MLTAAGKCHFPYNPILAKSQDRLEVIYLFRHDGQSPAMPLQKHPLTVQWGEPAVLPVDLLGGDVSVDVAGDPDASRDPAPRLRALTLDIDSNSIRVTLLFYHLYQIRESPRYRSSLVEVRHGTS